jgi:hypothetical protein
MYRWDILNHLIRKHQYRAYLEIGTLRKECFNKIDCPLKWCVDPGKFGVEYDFNMTSDEFFAQNSARFDIVFIDGLHAAAQVERDILNSFAVLNPGGRVVLHDCNPHDFHHHNYGLCGSVWKALYRLRCTRDDLVLQVVDADYGVGILTRGSADRLTDFNPYMDYEVLAERRKETLNLITVQEFLDLP